MANPYLVKSIYGERAHAPASRQRTGAETDSGLPTNNAEGEMHHTGHPRTSPAEASRRPYDAYSRRGDTRREQETGAKSEREQAILAGKQSSIDSYVNGLRFCVERYLPPPGPADGYKDQHSLPPVFVEGKCLHCWHERHSDWRTCKRACTICGSSTHESMVGGFLELNSPDLSHLANRV